MTPDIIVINLVLNDATESPSRVASEASDGFQLARSIEPGALSETTWARALRSLRRHFRGDALRDEAAKQSELGVYELLRSPEMPASRSAWGAHLEALEKLIAATQSLGATAIVVAHPYTVQFEVPGLWWPQSAYKAWCEARGVIYFDAADAIAKSGHPPVSCYHDGVHPNRRGASVIGQGIAGALIERGLLP